jgi:hypothetical protein
MVVEVLLIIKIAVLLCDKFGVEEFSAVPENNETK